MGWTSFGDAQIEHVKSYDGNNYIVASERNQSFHSFAQTFDLEKEKLYTFSVWLQLSHGNADVAAIFKTNTSYEIAGWITAQKGCWTMLKGGFVVDISGPALLYFESQNKEVDIWADNISLQPFTREEWTSHQQRSIEKVRKTKVKFQAVDQYGQAIPNATVSCRQLKSSFPFGCAINQNILHNTAYQNWFSSRFKYTVFENELKWYSNEQYRGSEDYSASDALLRFAQSHGVAVRGHNVFWDDPSYQPDWVPGLSTSDLWAAANKRMYSVMSRYRGQLFHWDVVNENLHFNFFESRLGYTAQKFFYGKANQIDGRTTLFLNDFNTIEVKGDGASSPFKYLQKVRDLRKHGYNGPLGIGLEGHFSSYRLQLPYIRSAIDQLASARLPIWITELDVSSVPNQVSYLEQILNEVHSHPGVQGIIIWAAWSPQGCYRMCLTDNNFNNLATGNVVDKFISRLSHANDFISATTDSNGFYEGSLYHGEYEVKIAHPNGDQFFELRRIDVVPEEKTGDIYRFTINV
ncbi:probable endo-1 4-beta-xylanase c [Phtheirospermum japonicum]|uniref:Probable endo-1 4-beta-xylanase c n=1 Tax=Phtheirospermum japonicum TaxID=374723 RepID=A0A830CF72_9LAMI|nr:probable endo-1 4-beta-xylanase c [Phtheirospermum japonicum]